MKPPNVFGARVRPFVSMLVLGEKRDAVGRKPQVMNGRLTKPFAARMIGIEFQVATNRRSFPKGSGRKGYRPRGVMARVEQLAGFQQHLDDVLVDGIPRRLSGTAVKKEDIHWEDSRKEIGKTVGRKSERQSERQQKAHRTKVVLGSFNFSDISLHFPTLPYIILSISYLLFHFCCDRKPAPAYNRWAASLSSWTLRRTRSWPRPLASARTPVRKGRARPVPLYSGATTKEERYRAVRAFVSSVRQKAARDKPQSFPSANHA